MGYGTVEMPIPSQKKQTTKILQMTTMHVAL